MPSFFKTSRATVIAPDSSAMARSTSSSVRMPFADHASASLSIRLNTEGGLGSLLREVCMPYSTRRSAAAGSYFNMPSQSPALRSSWSPMNLSPNSLRRRLLKSRLAYISRSSAGVPPSWARTGRKA